MYSGGRVEHRERRWGAQLNTVSGRVAVRVTEGSCFLSYMAGFVV